MGNNIIIGMSKLLNMYHPREFVSWILLLSTNHNFIKYSTHSFKKRMRLLCLQLKAAKERNIFSFLHFYVVTHTYVVIIANASFHSAFYCFLFIFARRTASVSFTSLSFFWYRFAPYVHCVKYTQFSSSVDVTSFSVRSYNLWTFS